MHGCERAAVGREAAACSILWCGADERAPVPSERSRVHIGPLWCVACSAFESMTFPASEITIFDTPPKTQRGWSTGGCAHGSTHREHPLAAQLPKSAPAQSAHASPSVYRSSRLLAKQSRCPPSRLLLRGGTAVCGGAVSAQHTAITAPLSRDRTAARASAVPARHTAIPPHLRSTSSPPLHLVTPAPLSRLPDRGRRSVCSAAHQS